MWKGPSVAVGRPSLIAPRTEPYERLSRIQLPPRRRRASLLLAHRSILGTLIPRTVSGECGIKRCSPWPTPFSPQAPPKIALLCSSGSSIVWRGPTPPERACLPYGFEPSQTGLVPFRAEALQRSPGSRACCFSACAGSPTTQDRLLARVIATQPCCLPPSGESRRPNFAFFEAQYPAHRYPCLRFK